MAETPSLPLPVGARVDHVFPRLTDAQIARIAAHGETRAVAAGEVLADAGDQKVPFLVVTAGALEVVRINGGVETLVAVHETGQFSGEVNMISGRRALFRLRAREAGTVVQLGPEQLVGPLPNDAELSEILMRAFILRRVQLVASGIGDAVLIGSRHSSGTLRVKE